MIKVSEVFKTAPTMFKTELQQKVYETLTFLDIPFERVDTEEAITMEDCFAINEKLDMKMVKTLFLCNSKKTELYLFITTADKPFSTKVFSSALGISRVSFAPSDLMETILGVRIGAATIFSTLTDHEKRLSVVIDSDVVVEEWYGCSDGTTTGYMKVCTKRILEDFLKHTGHEAKIIDIVAT